MGEGERMSSVIIGCDWFGTEAAVVRLGRGGREGKEGERRGEGERREREREGGGERQGRRGEGGREGGGVRRMCSVYSEAIQRPPFALF